MPDGRKVNHLYYGSGHLHQINLDGQVISDIERDDLHREVYRTQGKLTSCFGYDAMGRKAWQHASTLPADKLSQVHNAGIHTELYVEHRYNPIHRRYEYDPAGELVRTLDKLRGETRYTYQANGQLRSRDTGSILTSEEFRYDAAGNRLDFNARQFAKVTDNRIAKWRNCEYQYDAWGNLIEKFSGPATEQQFEYDCENRLVKAETFVAGKLTATGQYRYDSLGRRVYKHAEVDGVIEQRRFLWQGLRMLREQTAETDRLYMYEPNSYAPLARIDDDEAGGRQVYYFHTDQIGTPLELTNADGEVVWQVTYRAWGYVEQFIVQAVEQNLRFQGQYSDSESGLYYNGFRCYDAVIGRYVCQDPIGTEGGVNLYRYAPNPLAWIDPLGLLTYNTMPSIAGFQKHHIIPQQLAKHPAFLASGMSIHDFKNIIYLPSSAESHPTRTVHRGTHRAYTQRVAEGLDEIYSVGRQLNWTNAQYRVAVHELIRENRKGLRLGQIMLNKRSLRSTC
ncbi:RHS repeat-associated core domain-containing protein [Enterobacterales bacterium AW_CKDN230030176-1A_HGKHYDSX7]